ncbi:Hypothetical predicted protein [Mytilus galloprovincialis]|uniref:CCHC-type domain-containing protein n=1 Tax=Mytilus galloprovincialis TaxID=29158 RepID=A0A8B6F1L2_MYTGA|nr:Hypothetical predicted protein [Mytilus galloprovincialis]
MSSMDPLEQKNDQMSKDGLELDKETRLRTLTEKAQIEYDKTVTNYFSKLSVLKRNVDYEIGTYKSEDQTKESISVCQKRIEISLDKYLNMAEEISQYLKRKNTADSLQELENHESVYTNVELSADEVFRDIQRIQQRTKTKSVKSVRSNGRSSVASSTTKMKARAEAAKASLEFAAKEAELKKADAEIQRKQMDIQADLEFLSKQKEAAVAYAEYKAAMEDDDSQHDAKSLQGIPKQDELDRTRQYVESHRNVTFNSQNFRDNPVHSNTHLGDHTSAPFIPSTHQDQMPASKYNDPGFKFESDQNNNSPQARDKESGRSSQRPRLSARNINVSKTEIATSTEGIKPIKLKCAIHKTNHSLNDCRSFLSKSIEDRRKIIKENGICFKCINSKDHLSRNCPENVQCKECDSSTHSSGMHIYGQQKMQPLEPNGGEQSEDASKVVKACCMDICNGKFSGKSCAKILPVFVSHEDDPSKRIKTYIILDEQSNRSLGRKELFDSFDIVCKPEEYTLMSCSGRTRMNGRRVSGLLLESLDGHVTDSVKSYKTYIQAGGRPSLLKPCPNVISVRELLKTQNKLDNIDFDETKLGDGVFDRTEFDDTPGKSIEENIS